LTAPQRTKNKAPKITKLPTHPTSFFIADLSPTTYCGAFPYTLPSR
jgi:hypothetical protein